MHQDNLLDWILNLLESGDTKSENYLQVSELLSAILTNCDKDYKLKFTVTLQGMERILGIVNMYRRDKTLESEEELESVANIFDSLAALLLV